MDKTYTSKSNPAILIQNKILKLWWKFTFRPLEQVSFQGLFHVRSGSWTYRCTSYVQTRSGDCTRYEGIGHGAIQRFTANGADSEAVQRQPQRNADRPYAIIRADLKV